MMKKLLFEGTATALVTPFKGDGIDFDAMGKLIDMQSEGGVGALVICGTTGEAPTLEDGEHLDAIEFATDYVKKSGYDIKIIAGTGSNNTDHAVMMSREAEIRGADGLLWVTPYYNKTTQRGLLHHYETLAGATDLPAIIYNVPSRTGVDIVPDTAEALSKIENIVAIKEATGNVARTVEIISRCGDELYVYSGNDDVVVPMMSVGAKGVISVLSNICPGETEKMCRLAKEGDFKAAGAMQVKFYPLIKALFCEVNPIPVKTALELMGKIDGSLRLPLYEMEEKNKAKLEAEMKKLGII